MTEKAKMMHQVFKNLPGGLSCTEQITGGNMLSLYANHTVLSAIGLAVGIGSNDVSDEASPMPAVMSGVAGFLAGGMLMAGALLSYSKKQRGSRQPLLTEPEVSQ